MHRQVPASSSAVLGLIDKRPVSGYDLAALADRSLGYCWPISRTLIYRELTRLECLGWAHATDVAQDRLPDKGVWSTTTQGDAAEPHRVNGRSEPSPGTRAGRVQR